MTMLVFIHAARTLNFCSWTSPSLAETHDKNVPYYNSRKILIRHLSIHLRPSVYSSCFPSETPSLLHQKRTSPLETCLIMSILSNHRPRPNRFQQFWLNPSLTRYEVTTSFARVMTECSPQVQLVLPQELYSVVWKDIEAKISNIQYSRVIMSLSEILEGSFFNEYIKIGTLSLVHILGDLHNQHQRSLHLADLIIFFKGTS